MTCIKEENFAVNPMVTNYVKHQEKLLSVAYFKGKISNIFRQSKVVKSNSNYCQGSSAIWPSSHLILITIIINLLYYIASGGYIDDIHTKWWGDYSLLETHHGYIQWWVKCGKNQEIEIISGTQGVDFHTLV